MAHNTETQTVTVRTDGSLKIRPYCDTNFVRKVLSDNYGFNINSELKELVSYDDRNYLIQGNFKTPGNEKDECMKFVLKIFNASETNNFKWYSHINNIVAEIQQKNKVDFHLSVPVPDIQGTSAGLYDVPLVVNPEFINTTKEKLLLKCDLVSKDDAGCIYIKHMVRLVPFIEGETIDVKSVMAEDLMFQFGKSVAALSVALKEIPKPVNGLVRHGTLWNMLNTSKMLREPYVASVKDNERRKVLTAILNRYESFVEPILMTLPTQWIHGDASDQNVLYHNISSMAPNKEDEKLLSKIVGIIDFDEMCYSYRVIEIATTLMYVCSSSSINECILNSKRVFKGISSLLCLNDKELSVMYDIILLRFALSLCMGEYQCTIEDPNNTYLHLIQTNGWKILNHLMTVGDKEFIAVLKSS